MNPRPFYENRTVALYHGDARNILPELPREPIDLLLTDPPYGQNWQSANKVAGRLNVRADGARQGIRVVREVLQEVAGHMHPEAHRLLFCHWEGVPDFYDCCSGFFQIKNTLIWHKDLGGTGDTEMEYARDYEVILYGATGRRAIVGRRDGAVLRGFRPVPTKERVHTTQKPLALLAHLIQRHCPSGGLVCDPFAGSASTLVAAVAADRHAVGIELDEAYCEAGALRLERFFKTGEAA